MATITITRSLLEQGGTEDVNIISVFQRNSMEFDVERGATTGTYATVTVGSYEFRAVKTATSGTTDSYIIDLTSVLTNMVPIPDVASLTDDLITEVGISVNAYDSSNVVICTLPLNSITLCIGYIGIGLSGGMYDVGVRGSSRPIYHNGKIGIYYKDTSGMGLSNFILGGITRSYTIQDGYNTITMDSAHKINGTLTLANSATFSIPIYYKPPYGDEEIAWLNRDGGWSFWNFRKVSEEIAVKKSNEVATYYKTNAATISKSRMISAEKIVKHAFDTLAYDPTHFAQLCEIQESLAVIWNDKLVMVAKSNSLTAVCKQNLRFNIILEVDENIAGY